MTLGLLTGKVPEQTEPLLPNGQRVSFAVHESSVTANQARAVIIKDARDDPDCTHKAHMTVDVRLLADSVN